jgi:hypothetical protein
MRSHNPGLGVVLAVAVLAAGCVWSVPQPTLVREPRPEPVPLRIGVYHSPELRGATWRHHLTDTTWVLGEPSVRLLNDALALMFTEVVEVSARPPAGSLPPGLAGVIEPRIASAGFRYPTMGERAFPTHVTYVFTLYAPTGAPVASWSAAGTAAVPVGNPFGAVGTVKSSFEQAMREAAWKLTREFREVPDVRRWLDANEPSR